MNLKEIYKKTKKSTVISYEVFPPKNDTVGDKLDKLISELDVLKKFDPSLVSITYGAGGSNQCQSIEILKRIRNELKLTPMPHFTCVSTSRNHIYEYLNTIESLDVKNILALRGDIPNDGNEYCHDFVHADELVDYIKKQSALSVAVAGYPEGHIESPTINEDIKFLKQKVSKGADVIYTQLFFDNSKYFSFVDLCINADITVPIIPGILPVTNFQQMERMVSLCRVSVPAIFWDKLEKHKDDIEYTTKAGIDFASAQCSQLIENGVNGLHFYTLNKSFAVNQILTNIL